MKIAVPKAWPSEEKRVAVVPETAKLLTQLGFSVCVQTGGGEGAFFKDESYQEIEGVEVCSSEEELFEGAQVILLVGPPSAEQKKKIPQGAIVVGLLRGLQDFPLGTHVLNLELLPRISRAQSMDVLSSQSNLYGYWSVLQGACLLARVFPMMTTASGSLKPAQVVVLGAGVAGLQAIATARRLGAVVHAFDVRAAARGAVESLGASFIEVDASKTGEGAGGYARIMDEDYVRAQKNLIGQALTKADVVICSALVPGKEPPVLIEEDMVAAMRPGSVIIDLATDRYSEENRISGNCALSQRGHIIEAYKVRIVGPFHGLSALSQDASALYARNLYEFIKYAWDKENQAFRSFQGDEILEAVWVRPDLEKLRIY